MIAGHAKLLDYMMITNNVSEFGRVHTSSQAQATQQNLEVPFSFHNTVELPYSSEWFKVPPGAPNGQTPKLGVLHPSMTQHVRVTWEAAQTD